MNTINIAKDFSKLPGPRYIHEGANSGEEFREKVLRPQFERAQLAGEKLRIQLDGVTFGYPSSFLEESFGGLARLVGIETVRNGLTFESNDEPMLLTEVDEYIRDAAMTPQQRAAARQQGAAAR
jgi:hypothetical protein